MCEVTFTCRRSNMSSKRGNPSLKPYSYHLVAGKSGYLGSIGGIGLSAPLAGCAPASICIEIERTRRAPSGQAGSVERRVVDFMGEDSFCRAVENRGLETAPKAIAEAVLFLTKSRRFITVASPPKEPTRNFALARNLPGRASFPI